MPCCEGILPVKKHARAGEQTGEGVKAWVMRVPVVAMRSIWGVTSSEFPLMCCAHCPWSSVRKTRMLGRRGLSGFCAGETSAKVSVASAAPVIFRKSRRGIVFIGDLNGSGPRSCLDNQAAGRGRMILPYQTFRTRHKYRPFICVKEQRKTATEPIRRQA